MVDADWTIPEFLQDLSSVAVGVFSRTGDLSQANRGLREILCRAGWDQQSNASGFFLRPAFSELLQIEAARPNEPFYLGIIHLGCGHPSELSLRGRLNRVHQGFLLSAEYDRAEYEQLQMAIISLNEELTQTQRQLTRDIRRAEQAEQAVRAGLETSERLRRDQQALERLISTTQRDTARAWGHNRLSELNPQLFIALSFEYRRLLDLALEQRIYRVEYHLSEQCRKLAERLGGVWARPRDLIELHNAALKARENHENSHRISAYLEESRLMLLEMMGDLAAYYRKLAKSQESVN